MQDDYEAIRGLGAEVLVVSFSPPPRVAAYVARYPLAFPVVADPELTGYRAFDLGRAAWYKLAGLQAITGYLKLMLRGWMPGKPVKGDDVHQLGGDFVLDAQRRLVYAYRSRDPTDRPPAEELIRAVRGAIAGHA